MYNSLEITKATRDSLMRKGLSADEIDELPIPLRFRQDTHARLIERWAKYRIEKREVKSEGDGTTPLLLSLKDK